MTDVFRGKYGGLARNALFGYLLHGATAVGALWLVFKALGA